MLRNTHTQTNVEETDRKTWHLANLSRMRNEKLNCYKTSAFNAKAN